jgi:hypothetical protein
MTYRINGEKNRGFHYIFSVIWKNMIRITTTEKEV